MAGKTLTSSLIVRLIDQVSGPARKVGTALKGLNSLAGGGGIGAKLSTAIERNNAALDKARGRLIDAGIGFYLLKAAINAPLKAAADFESQLVTIGQKADIPRERLGKLGEQIKQIAIDTNQSATQIATAIDSLVGAGASETVAMTAAAPIGKAATAYQAATADLAAAVYAAVINLKIPAEQAEKVLDILSQAGKEGKFELRDMAQYIPGLAGRYAALGQTGTGAVADIAAGLEVLMLQTGDASTAATNLQNVLQKIYAPQTIANFAKKGVDLRKEMDAAMAAGKTPLEALADITNRTLKGDLSHLGDLFQDAQVQAGLLALIQNMDEYLRIRKEANNASGVVDKDFVERMKTAQGAIDRWNTSIQNLNITLGTTLLPLLNGVLDAIVPIIANVGKWVQEHPQLTSAVVSTVTALVAFRIAMAALTFVGLLGKGGALSLLAIGFNTVGKSVRNARSAVALQSSLAGLSGAKYSGLAKFFDGLKGMLLVVPGVSLLANALGAIGLAIGGISLGAAAAIGVVIGSIAAAGFLIWKYWDRLSSIFSGVAQAIGDKLKPALDMAKPLLDWLSPIGQKIGDGFKAAWDNIAGFFATLFSQETLTDQQKEGMRQAGYNAMMAMLDGMKSMFTGILEWFSTWPSQILAAIGNINVGSLFSFGSAPAAAAPAMPAYSDNPMAQSRGGSMPGRARGGPVWGGSTYRINERGDEIFSPGRSGTITPMSKLGGGRPISIGPFNFHGISGDQAELERTVQRAVQNGVNSLLRGAHADMEAR